MRRLLLDTHVFLWWLENSSRLGANVRQVIGNPNNTIFVSAATAWEIAIKRALGKLRAPDDLGAVVTEKGFRHLPISFAHGERAGALPPHHRDPFDRMLIGQAEMEDLELVSGDSRLTLYGVKLLSAND